MLVPRRVVVAVAVWVCTGSACGGANDEVVVFGASSLTDVLDEVAERYADETGVDVVVNAAGSSSLVAQLRDGAPADVLITADAPTMDAAVAAGVVDAPAQLLARNELVIAVEAGNPQAIGGLDDLAADDVVVVIAAPEVPAGRYAAEALDCAGVIVRPSSLEQSVRSAASKVAIGEADAAIVYRTDVGDTIEAVEIEPECRVDAAYLIAGAGGPAGDAFVDYMLGAAGAAVLTANGFGAP